MFGGDADALVSNPIILQCSILFRQSLGIALFLRLCMWWGLWVSYALVPLLEVVIMCLQRPLDEYSFWLRAFYDMFQWLLWCASITLPTFAFGHGSFAWVTVLHCSNTDSVLAYSDWQICVYCKSLFWNGIEPHWAPKSQKVVFVQRVVCMCTRHEIKDKNNIFVSMFWKRGIDVALFLCTYQEVLSVWDCASCQK